MSVERLGGLVLRAAAPVGRAPPAELAPAFDAPAAVATAALEAGLAAGPATPPALRRRATPQMASPAAQHARAPEIAVAIPVRAAAAPTGSDALRDKPAQAAPSLRRDADRPINQPRGNAPTLAPPLQTSRAQPIASAAATPPVVAEAVIVAPTPEEGASQSATSFAEPPTPERVQVIASASPPLHGEQPLPATPSAAEPGPSDAAPTVTIGTVEVVIAPPPVPSPQRAAAPARQVPDRGFARYAAMRTARDRAW